MNGGERKGTGGKIFNITHTSYFFFPPFTFQLGDVPLMVDTTPQLVAIYIDVHAHKRHTPHGLFDSHSISLSPILSGGRGGLLIFLAHGPYRLSCRNLWTDVSRAKRKNNQTKQKQKKSEGWKSQSMKVSRNNKIITPRQMHSTVEEITSDPIQSGGENKIQNEERARANLYGRRQRGPDFYKLNGYYSAIYKIL